MIVDDAGPVFISIPDALGALVLNGAAYREDSRDKERHLDDAVVLCATIRNPLVRAGQMKGSDKSRILSLHKKLADPGPPVLANARPGGPDHHDGCGADVGHQPWSPAGEPAQARLTTTVTREAAPRRRWT